MIVLLIGWSAVLIIVKVVRPVGTAETMLR